MYIAKGLHALSELNFLLEKTTAGYCGYCTTPTEDGVHARKPRFISATAVNPFGPTCFLDLSNTLAELKTCSTELQDTVRCM